MHRHRIAFTLVELLRWAEDNVDPVIHLGMAHRNEGTVTGDTR